MPGIYGCINRDKSVVPSFLVKKMVNSLMHDDTYESDWVLDDCLLGITDHDFLFKRNIPIFKKDNVIGIIRGNIYNIDKLCKKYDIVANKSYTNNSEFLVKLYKKKDIEYPKYLNGLYVSVIYDKNKGKIIIANDRYGYFPFFYSLTPNRFMFSSEIKTILMDPDFPRSINKLAIPEFFTFSYLLNTKTFFENVNFLQPSHTLTYDLSNDSIALNRYWDFTLKKYDSHTPLVQYLKSFNKHMGRAVLRRMKDSDQIGIFLSGGLDSRIIAAFASRTNIPVIAYTFGVKNCEEDQIAKHVSEILGLEHHFIEIPSDFIPKFAEKIVYRGDGLIRIRDSHFTSILDEVSKTVKTVLMGTFGGDLSCRPQGRLVKNYVSLRDKEEINDYLFHYYTKQVTNVLPEDKHQEAFKEDFYKEIKSRAKTTFFNIIKNIHFEYPDQISDYWEYRNREPRYIFQASQHVNWYLETRHPYMDNDLVDFFAFKFPVDLRRREFMGVTFEDTFLQRSLNYEFPELSDIPWHDFKPGSNILDVIAKEGPRFILKRSGRLLSKLLRKQVSLTSLDFRGYDEWLRTGSRSFVMDIFSDERTLNRPYFQRDFLSRVVDDHMNYKNDNNQLICDIINFELMHRLFFEKSIF